MKNKESEISQNTRKEHLYSIKLKKVKVLKHVVYSSISIYYSKLKSFKTILLN